MPRLTPCKYPCIAALLVACGTHPGSGTAPKKYTGPVPEVLTTELTCPVDAEIDGENIYAATGPLEAGSTGSIVRIPLGGGKPEVIAKDQVEPGAIAITDDEVWWVTHSLSDGGELRRAPKAANVTTGTLVASGLVKPLSLVIDHRGNAWWGGPNGVWEHAAGADPTARLQRYDQATTRGLVEIDGRYVVAADLVSSERSLTAVPIDGGPSVEYMDYLFAVAAPPGTPKPHAEAVVASGSWIAWISITTPPHSQINGRSFSDRYNRLADLAREMRDPVGLAVDESYAYVLDDRRLFTVTLESLTFAKHDFVSDTGVSSEGRPALLLVDDHHVYWAQCGGDGLHAKAVPARPEVPDGGHIP